MALFFGALPLRSAASSPPERGDSTLVYSDPLQIGERPLQGKTLHPEGFLRLDPSIAAVPEDFIITFTGDWSAEAKAAFNYAASIWSALIDPKVKISIKADPGSTGGSAVTAVYSNIIDNLPRENTLYPRALANHLLGYDVHPDQVDFDIYYNPSFEWYYGTDGNTPLNQVDFVSVVLHEIGHGLGFISSFGLNVDYSLDQYEAHWGSINNWPYLYDTLIENGAGQSLTDTSLFPNSSTALEKSLIEKGEFPVYEGKDFPLPPVFEIEAAKEANKKSVLKIISEARQLEKTAEKAYTSLAAQIKDPQGHETFARLAREENAHYFILSEAYWTLSNLGIWKWTRP